MTNTAPFDAAEDAVGDALDALAAISGVDTRAARNVLFTILETITGARAAARGRSLRDRGSRFNIGSAAAVAYAEANRAHSAADKISRTASAHTAARHAEYIEAYNVLSRENLRKRNDRNAR